VLEKVYQIALGLIPGIGAKTTKQLISYIGSAEKIFTTPKGKLLKVPEIGEKTAKTIVEANKDAFFKQAESQIEKAKKNNTKIWFYTDKEYPSRLKLMPDAPTLLFSKGNADYENTKVLAIVGTRSATEYGKDIVKNLIKELAPFNPLIVSGLAYGIDAFAHKEALANNLQTVGVLGNGINKIYPALHKPLVEKMLEHEGAILTEYHFDVEAQPPHFPERNRIVAGLCDGIIVVEAAEKGGALITAELANSYDREVMAFPGDINKKYSEGCNNLIKYHKAAIITSALDVVKQLNWDIEVKNSKQKLVRNSIPEHLTENERIIYVQLLEDKAIHIDELSWKTQIDMSQLSSILLSLEFQGLVKAMPGKKFGIV
jgi:DNA processing protein